MPLSPGQIALVGLLAAVPAIVYAQSNADAFAAVAAGNVVVIVASLRTMLGGRESIARAIGAEAG